MHIYTTHIARYAYIATVCMYVCIEILLYISQSMYVYMYIMSIYSYVYLF